MSEYPDQYGKSPSHGADDVPHPMVPTMLLQIDFIVFLERIIGSMFAYCERSFKKKCFFL